MVQAKHKESNPQQRRLRFVFSDVRHATRVEPPSNLVVCYWKIEQQHFLTVSTRSRLHRSLGCWVAMRETVSGEAMEILFKTVKKRLKHV